MAIIIAIANQKGGVGKTTTAINLATAFAAIDKNVALIDLDPQGNATTGLGLSKHINPKFSTYGLITGLTELRSILKRTEIPNLLLAPATVDLAAVDVELCNIEAREMFLTKAMEKIQNSFDYIIMDCPPSLGLITINALTAANEVMIPMQCEFYALEGLAQLTNTVRLIKNKFNPLLKIGGILLTMYDARRSSDQYISREVKKHFSSLVCHSVIPRNTKVCEAPLYGKPVILYDFSSQGSLAYINLAKEILKKHRSEYEQKQT